MDDDTEILGPDRGFKTTSWDIVRAAVDPATQDLLVRIYWKPLYVFARTRGHDNETAKDLVQDFFVALLERRMLHKADPSKGRFRNFLLTLMRNFLADWKRSEGAEKRGGRARIRSIDFSSGEGEFARHASAGESPERSVERAWARGLFDECVSGLEANPAHLKALRLRLSGVPYAAVTRETGLGEAAAQVAVHRLAAQLGRELRKRLLLFVRTREELDAEIEDFMRLIS